MRIHKVDHRDVKKRQLLRLLTAQTGAIQAGSILDKKVRALGEQLGINWNQGLTNIKANLIKELNASVNTVSESLRKR